MDRNITRPGDNFPKLFAVAAISLLAVLAYLPTLRQPFIEDDYPNIALSRQYGPISHWGQMAKDKVNRVRATSFVLMHWIESLAGLHASAFYAVSIALHVCNCLLLYALGRWALVGFRVSAWAAAFFAIFEGHQEAIMWFSACNELLLFFFGLLALICWLIFIESTANRWRWYTLSLACFALALLSKESSVIIIPLLCLPLWASGFKLRKGWPVLPFPILALIYVLSIFGNRDESFRFHDQSFVLSAPFWETWSHSFFALLFPWGWLAVLVLFVRRNSGRLLSLAIFWTSISLAPYMFVAYQYRIPSRQTYLASTGLALLVGGAVVVLRDQVKQHRRGLVRAALCAALCIVLLDNVVYLWTRKHRQFLQRAAPTENLIAFAQRVDGPIYVRCFPRPPIIGNAAVEVMLGRPAGTLIWNEAEAKARHSLYTFCDESK